MEIIDRINIFKDLHSIFIDMILDDTWLCTKPID